MNKPLVILSGLVGLLLLGLAVVYFSTPANALPTVFPGYDANSMKIHTKHGIGALFLALASGAFAWFQSGPKSADQKHDKND